MASLPLGLHGQTPPPPTMVEPDRYNPDQKIPGVAFNAQNTGADYQEDGQGNRLRMLCWDGDQPGLAWHYTGANGSTVIGRIPLVGARQGQLMENGFKVVDPPAGLPTDPDVVAYYDRDKGNWYVVVTFIQQVDGSPRSLYSIYQFEPKGIDTGANLTLVPGAYAGPIGGPGAPFWEYPQLVSRGFEAPDCSFSNLDVGLDGYVAFTFASGGLIYGRARDIRGGQVAPTPPAPFTLVRITPGDYATCMPHEELLACAQPDVSIRQEPGESDPIVQFCYAQKNTDDVNGDYWHYLINVTLPVSQMQQGVSPTCASQMYSLIRLQDVWDQLGDDKILQHPRITSVYGPNTAPDDAFIVGQQEQLTYPFPIGAAYTFIHMFARAWQYGPTFQARLLNFDATNFSERIAHCGNFRPAVAAAPGRNSINGIATWSYNAYAPGAYQACLKPESGDPYPTNFEVISRNTTDVGNPINIGLFSRVNDVLAGKQYAPSVASGRMTGTNSQGENILYAWLNEPDNSIRYQDAQVINTNLRPVAPSPTDSLTLSPNPADAGSTLTVTLANPEAQLLGIEVISSQLGRLTTTTPEAIAARLRAMSVGQWTVPLRELLPATTPPGIYAVRLRTTKGVKTVRLAYTGAVAR